MNPGLSLLAAMNFSGSSSAPLGHMQSLTGAPDGLVVQATITTADLQLFMELDGFITIPTGGSDLKIGNAALRIDLTDETVFQLSGTMSFTVNGTEIDATVKLIIDESEAEVAVLLTGGDGTLGSPPGVEGLRLDQIGIEMGVFFEPPGLDLGIVGKCKVGDLSTQDDEFGLVLEMVEEVPNLLYLSFYLDELDLPLAVTLFTDEAPPDALDVLKAVQITDLSFYFAENVVVLPDGTIAQPGFAFSGTLSIFGFGAHADLSIGATTGISGDAMMAPLNLANVLSITGDGPGRTQTYAEVDGQWQRTDNRGVVRTNPPPPTREGTVVEPGGPILHISSHGEPYLHLDIRVSLFDIANYEVEADITNAGITFELGYDLAGVADFKLDCTLKDWTSFNAQEQFTLGLDEQVGPIEIAGINCGSIHLQADLAANLSIGISSDSFWMMVSGGFDFEGLSLSLPPLQLSVSPAQLSQLPEMIVQQIKDNASEIFKDLFEDLGRYAELVRNGIITGIDDLGAVLKNVYNVAAEDAARIMQEMGRGVEEIAASLQTAYGYTADAAAATLNALGYGANEIGNVMFKVYGLAPDGVAAVLKGVGYGATAIAGAMVAVYNLNALAIGPILNTLGYGISDIGSAVKDIFGDAGSIATALHEAGYAAEDVANFLKATGSFGEDTINDALNGVGYAADEVAKTMGDIFGGKWLPHIDLPYIDVPYIDMPYVDLGHWDIF